MTDPAAVDAPRVLAYDGTSPVVAADAWIAPGATVIGAVRIGPRSSVWYGAVIRADQERIELGTATNLQDGAVMHADAGFPAILGDRVTVGHRAVVHGSVVGDDTLIGMGAVLLNGATVGAGCLVAAGTVLLEGTEIPPGSLVAGVPGKVRRELTDEEMARVVQSARTYDGLRAGHATMTRSGRG